MTTGHVADEDQQRFEAYKTQTNKVVEEAIEARNKQQRHGLVYHYTNDAGLMGVLESGTFWFTHISYLNDPSELKHGTKPVRDLIEAATAQEGEYVRFAKPILQALDEKLHDTAKFFICSFSFHADDLDQWRAYGDNGHGYAIGFDKELLENALNARTGRHSQSYAMDYSDVNLQDLQMRIAKPALELVPTIGNNMGKLATHLAQNAINVALCYKHSAYKNECELRFLELYAAGADIGAALRFRAKGYKRVPYLAVDWLKIAPKALKHIVIGPAANADRATEFAKQCLRASGIESTADNITLSTIPFKS